MPLSPISINVSSKYKFSDQEKLYFVTFAVVYCLNHD